MMGKVGGSLMFLRVGGGDVMRWFWLVSGGLKVGDGGDLTMHWVIGSGVRGFRGVVVWRLKTGGGYGLVDGKDGGEFY